MGKVEGIPTLVIVDGEGNTITTDGVSAVSEDPVGSDFPWKPKSMQELMKAAVLKKESATVDIKSAFEGKAAVGLYFSAHWCPPCRGFTPKLAEWYKKDLQSKGLEIVFVSSDKDEAMFKDYYAEQPWLALDYSDRSTKNQLSKVCKVRGIPSFVIIDPSDYSIINFDGRAAVTSDPEGKDLPWKPKPVRDLSAGPGPIQQIPTVLVLCETSDAAEQESIEAALTPVGTKYRDEAKAKGEDPEINFMVAKASSDLSGKIRDLTALESLPPAASGSAPKLQPKMLLIDIPSNGAFYVAPEGTITSAAVEKLIADFKAGSLERKQLGQ